MSQLALNSLRHSLQYDEMTGPTLTSTQRQIMEILKLNKEQLENNELDLSQHLEERKNQTESFGISTNAARTEAVGFGNFAPPSVFNVNVMLISY